MIHELSVRPEGGSNKPAQGNALGTNATMLLEALKGRNTDATMLSFALSGLVFRESANPGRCPGLAYRCPIGAEPQQGKVTTPSLWTDS